MPRNMLDPFPLDFDFELMESNNGFTLPWDSEFVFINSPWANHGHELALYRAFKEFLVNGKTIAVVCLTRALRRHPLFDIISELCFVEDLGQVTFANYEKPLKRGISLVIMLSHDFIPKSDEDYKLLDSSPSHLLSAKRNKTHEEWCDKIN